MNFSDFFGGMGGGFPGMGGGMPGQKEEDVDTTKFYETLGIKKDADPKTLKKAYRKLAMKNHPDRGGDTEKFKKIQEAYEILSDPEKRKIYDEYGAKAAKEGSVPGMGGIFGGRSRRPTGPQKDPPITYPLNVSLQDVYNGKVKHLRYQRDVIIVNSTGKVIETNKLREAWTTCSKCGGKGMVLMSRRMGNMIMQQQARCPTCKGKGHDLKKGYTLKKKTETIEVDIEKGMKTGSKIKLRDMGDMHAGSLPADLVVTLKTKKHAKFQRKGADLLVEYKMSLKEALCGFRLEIEHLDGRKLIVDSKRGERIVSPGDIKCIPNEGMPVRGDAFTRGRLFIHFKIEFPSTDELTSSQFDKLANTLPGPSVFNSNESKSNGNVKDKKADDKMKQWRNLKMKQWNETDSKLKAKYPTLEKLTVWMDKQCERAQKLSAENNVNKNNDDNSNNMDTDDEDENIEYCTMEDIDLSKFGKSHAGAYHSGALESDSEDEGQGGPGGVQCQQM